MTTLRIDLIDQDADFPHFAVAAQHRGIRAGLSVPAAWGAEVVGTLNIYSRTGPFDETAAAIAAVLGAQVAIAISRSPEFAPPPAPWSRKVNGTPMTTQTSNLHPGC